jgi:hypothetical protein
MGRGTLMPSGTNKIDINFPQSSMPGQRPGEGQGRLLNCFCEVDGGIKAWRTVPGLKLFTNLGFPNPRGMFVKGALLFVAVESKLLTVSQFGTVTPLSGSLEGNQPVTVAINNREPTADMIITTEIDTYVVTGTSFAPLGSPDLPLANSVASFDGYFMWTISDGRLFASDLNNTTIDPLSFTTCQADPDGLLRGVSYGSVFYAMGPNSIEAYTDAGTSPFPLTRSGVIQVGLFGPWAVAGYGSGWNANPFFVASDHTVRRIDGYTAVTVSTKDVERDIAKIADHRTIIMGQHVTGGHSIITITSPLWTWEFNATTNFWHERKSFSMDRWRAEFPVLFNNKWYIGDHISTNLYEISEDAQDEDGAPLEFWIESAPVKQFPEGVQAYTGFFDWTVGVGQESATVHDTDDPTVSIFISKDGGGNWVEVAERSLGQQGQYGTPVRVNRMAGATSYHGLRVRCVVSSPVYRTFRGARMSGALRIT